MSSRSRKDIARPVSKHQKRNTYCIRSHRFRAKSFQEQVAPFVSPCLVHVVWLTLTCRIADKKAVFFRLHLAGFWTSDN